MSPTFNYFNLRKYLEMCLTRFINWSLGTKEESVKPNLHRNVNKQLINQTLLCKYELINPVGLIKNDPSLVFARLKDFYSYILNVGGFPSGGYAASRIWLITIPNGRTVQVVNSGKSN